MEMTCRVEITVAPKRFVKPTKTGKKKYDLWYVIKNGFGLVFDCLNWLTHTVRVLCTNSEVCQMKNQTKHTFLSI